MLFLLCCFVLLCCCFCWIFVEFSMAFWRIFWLIFSLLFPLFSLVLIFLLCLFIFFYYTIICLFFDDLKLSPMKGAWLKLYCFRVYVKFFEFFFLGMKLIFAISELFWFPLCWRSEIYVFFEIFFFLKFERFMNEQPSLYGIEFLLRVILYKNEEIFFFSHDYYHKLARYTLGYTWLS